MAELKIISMDEVQSKEVNWLWYPYIPYGKITIIQGDPGEGKTTLALRLAALLSKGEALPYDNTEREPVKIIYQTAEDGLEDTIKPRLEAAEADCTQIKVIDESEAALSMLDERIEKAIIEIGARVVILDPIQAYVGANINMNNANEVRNVMAQLGRIAEKYDCAVLLVGHMNKGSGNKSSYRGLGSIDFQASARSVLIVGRIKDNPQVRVMVQDKSSLAPEGEAIAFELDKEERLFCVIAYLPKATVQAAIGSVPLAMGLSCGQIVLSVAVLAILITAPLGAIGMDLTYKKLLVQEELKKSETIKAE